MASVTPTLEEQIEELEREYAQRERIYPRWINARKPKLSPFVAQRRQRELRAAIESLRRLKAMGETTG